MIEWICVVDDGTRPYGPGIQVDQRRPLRLVCGESSLIRIRLIDPVGGSVSIVSPDPDFIVLNARDRCRPSSQLFTARAVPRADRVHDITLDPSVTRVLDPQLGTFDLWLIRGPERICLIPTSDLTLAPSALGGNFSP